MLWVRNSVFKLLVNDFCVAESQNTNNCRYCILETQFPHVHCKTWLAINENLWQAYAHVDFGHVMKDQFVIEKKENKNVILKTVVSVISFQ